MRIHKRIKSNLATASATAPATTPAEINLKDLTGRRELNKRKEV